MLKKPTYEELKQRIQKLEKALHEREATGNDQEILAALNQQLVDSNLQLKSTEQQLRTSNQQLEASNQRLNTTEQQLKATEQQLGASNQQLKASNQQLQSIVDKLRESEERYRILFRSASDAILIIDVKSLRILDVNEAAIQLYGYSYEELIKMKVIELSNEPDKTRKAIQEGVEPIIPIRYHKKKGGHVFPAEITVNHFEFQGERITISGIRDITDRQRAEESLQRLAKAIDQVDESVEITDSEPKILYVNPAFEKITGYSKEEIIGKNPRLLQSGRHSQAFYQDMWSTLSKGKVWRGQLENKRKDGSLFFEDASISPVLDNQGKIINYVAVKRDISKELELESRLQQALKMEAIGTLAGGIAHDFNNILTAVIGFTELALDEAQTSSLQNENLTEVLNAGKRAKELVYQILTFARQTDEEIKPLRVDLIVKEAMKLIRSTVPATIKIITDIQSQSLAMADATQIHQIVMNLCANAAQAMEDGGSMTIKLKDVMLDENFAANHPNLKKGKYIHLKVSDTGCGISPDIVESIFEPYFTTKSPGEGTGMGLATVYGIVKQCGGEVMVESEVNRGSEFDVYFPIIQKQTQMESYQPDEVPTGNEMVLLVDDEPPIAKMGKRLLIGLGYDVTVRTSSVEALELFRAKPDAYDLVITDMTMPNMTGDKLATELMKIRPDIPIILCTGFSKQISEESASRMGVKAFVYKPIVKANLANAVREVLDAAKG
jgi:PAS domain S-box-containing protein